MRQLSRQRELYDKLSMINGYLRKFNEQTAFFGPSSVPSKHLQKVTELRKEKENLLKQLKELLTRQPKQHKQGLSQAYFYPSPIFPTRDAIRDYLMTKFHFLENTSEPAKPAIVGWVSSSSSKAYDGWAFDDSNATIIGDSVVPGVSFCPSASAAGFDSYLTYDGFRLFSMGPMIASALIFQFEFPEAPYNAVLEYCLQVQIDVEYMNSGSAWFDVEPWYLESPDGSLEFPESVGDADNPSFNVFSDAKVHLTESTAEKITKKSIFYSKFNVNEGYKSRLYFGFSIMNLISEWSGDAYSNAAGQFYIWRGYEEYSGEGVKYMFTPR